MLSVLKNNGCSIHKKKKAYTKHKVVCHSLPADFLGQKAVSKPSSDLSVVAVKTSELSLSASLVVKLSEKYIHTQTDKRVLTKSQHFVKSSQLSGQLLLRWHWGPPAIVHNTTTHFHYFQRAVQAHLIHLKNQYTWRAKNHSLWCLAMIPDLQLEICPTPGNKNASLIIYADGIYHSNLQVTHYLQDNLKMWGFICLKFLSLHWKALWKY